MLELKNTGIELEVIDLDIIAHVVLDKHVKVKTRTAHARSKKKGKKENRTIASRSASKCLTDCANRASLLNVGGIIDVAIPGITFGRGLGGIEGLLFQHQVPKDYFLLSLGPILDK